MASMGATTVTRAGLAIVVVASLVRVTSSRLGSRATVGRAAETVDLTTVRSLAGESPPMRSAIDGGRAGPGPAARSGSEVRTAAAYNAVTGASGAHTVLLPVFRGNCLSYRVTAVSVMNIGEVAADISLIAYDADGKEYSGRPGMSATRGVFETAYFFPWWILRDEEWLDRTTSCGTARVESSQPVVVAVHEISAAGLEDDGIHMGLRAAAGADPAGSPRLVARTPLAVGNVPVSEHDRGAADTRMIVTNVEPEREAMGDTSFWQYSAEPSLQLPFPSIPAWNTAITYFPQLQYDHGRWSAATVASAAIGVVANTEFTTRGAVTYHDEPIEALELVVPLAYRDHRGRCTMLAIQNASNADATEVTVVYLPEDDPARPVVSPAFRLEANRGRTVSVCNDPPFAGADRASRGAMRVLSSNAPVVAFVFVDIGGREAEQGFEAIAGSGTATMLYAPSVRAGFRHEDTGYQASTSTIAILNPGSVPVSATVTYRGALGACLGRTYVDGPHALDPGATALVRATRSLAAVLPPGCVASAVVRSSGGPVAAVVLDESLPMRPPAPLFVPWAHTVRRNP